ncbi:hypothetical protein D8674_000220 [Pyrus ussuriensis x Pyrus communis]|uniref:Uncharacterized protein n=1 Tax=Pyrus ussuriensis x Pyrus communis TaxID=2448454 RepID=A0A5N5F880_9ROSA|nr:hypothetical protein D8674_000220 [Pyrus ussuriensis x Pyrus communis]
MVSSFSNPGFPPMHGHPTHLPAMDARLSAAIDSFEALVRAAVCKAVASTLAAIHKAGNPVLKEIRSDLA